MTSGNVCYLNTAFILGVGRTVRLRLGQLYNSV